MTATGLHRLFPAWRPSRLALGGAGVLMDQFGGHGEETAIEAIRTAVDLGVTLFDTAPIYGNEHGRLSEERLGMALAATPPGEVLVATKVGLDRDAAGDLVDDRGWDATWRSVERSCRALRRDHIDLVQLHEVDEACLDSALADKGAFGALTAMQAEGIVTAIGITGSAVGPLREALRRRDFDSLQVWRTWNLLDASADGLLDDAAQQDMAVLVGGPFASGILAAEDDDAQLHYRAPSAEEAALVRRLRRAAHQHGTSIAATALSWALDARVTSAVVGVRDADDVRANLAHLDNLPGRDVVQRILSTCGLPRANAIPTHP